MVVAGTLLRKRFLTTFTDFHITLMFYLGIDVSKAKFDCALQRPDTHNTHKRLNKTVANTPAGINDLLAWLDKHGVAKAQLHIIMEPTGVYHERAATALVDAGCTLSLVNPARLRSYATALGISGKNDSIDSVVLARYGAAEKPKAWTPASPVARTLSALLARREALAEDIRREENRQEKALSALATPALVLASLTESIEFLSKQLTGLDRDINDHIDSDPGLKNNDRLLQTINGVGPRVASRMNALMSTHRFDNAEALAAYLGLVPSERQSGTSVRGKARMSKRGPSDIRKLLYLPAVVATRCNPQVKALYERLLARGKPKMAAIGAAMRKLAHLCFGVIHTQKPYDPHYKATAA